MRSIKPMNTIKEIVNENKPFINSNDISSETSLIKSVTREKNLKDANKMALKSRNSINSIGFKENLGSNNNKISNFSNNKNLEDNKSVYSNSKKGESSSNKKLSTYKKTVNKESSLVDSLDGGLIKGNLKEIIEKENEEVKILNLINTSIEFFQGDKYFMNNIKEEKDKFEMIEKEKYQKMKENNLEYKQKKINVTEDYNNLLKNLKDISKNIENLKSTYNQLDKSKEESRNEIYYQENDLKELNILNDKIHEMVLDNRMKKNNIVKALVQVCKKHSESIPKNKKKLFENFYNKNLEDFVQMKNEKKIKNLKEKIFNLEEELKLKNKEFENMKNNIN